VSISTRARSSFAGPLSPEYVLLGLLARQPAHGYELHQKLSGDLGQVWRLSLSQVYNILNRLESQDLIAGEIEEQDKLPARRRYHLTPDGRAHFENWLHAPTRSSGRAIRVEFTTRLYFAKAISPQLAHQLIDDQIAETRAGLIRLQNSLADIPPGQVFNRLGTDLRLRQLASILSWLDQCHTVIGGK
jgi:DNA-binding PadR family transcriptional regulator